MTLLLSSDRALRTVLGAALCTGLAAALVGCAADPDEGTNGVGKLPADRIEAKALTAVSGAGAVRLSGELVSQGHTYKLDMRLKKSGGAGSVTLKDGTFELLRVNEELFLKADAGFWKPAGRSAAVQAAEQDTEAAEKLDDKYVKVPQNDPAYKQLRGFTDLRQLLDGLLELHGELSTGKRARIGGVRTIKIIGSDGAGGALDVSLEGVPYPLRLVRAGGAGTVTLAEWGEDFPLEAPAKGQTVDYGSRLPRN